MNRYEEIAADLRQEAARRVGRHELHFPTEMQLCEKYQVSRQTIRRSLQLLEEEGIIVRKQGSGCRLTGRLSDPHKNRVSILLTSMSDYIYPDILGSLRTHLGNAGFQVLVGETHGDFMRERQILTDLLKDPPRALFAECFSAYNTPNADLFSHLEKAGCLVSFLFGTYRNVDFCPYIGSDDEQGGYDLVSFLVRRGHRKIAGIFRSDKDQSRGRYYGTLRAMVDHGLDFPADHFHMVDAGGVYELLHTRNQAYLDLLLSHVFPDCTAVICYNDELSYPLIRLLKKKGIRVPEDIAVVSFDGSYLRKAGDVMVTSMRHDGDEPGSSAARMLMRRIQGQETPNILLPWKLLGGNSV